ncbi:hypothetical protein NMY22_g9012 [Coprinellus aureogranulatus]|nr:hypothetical protein NMY22_g9012 [Coprinellus aureogranulatus]
MFSRLTSNALLVIALTFLIACADAKDIRAFSGSGCTGAFFTCLGLSSGQCCNISGGARASVRVTDGSGVARTVGFANSGCSGTSAIGLGGSCSPSNVAITSTHWIASGSRIGALTFREPLPAGECVEPQGFGFIDQDGSITEGILPTDEKEKERVTAAVNANNGEAIKVALGL